MVVPHNNFVLTYFLYKIHLLQTTTMQQMLFSREINAQSHRNRANHNMASNNA